MQGDYLIWVDLEMTGLNPDKDRIIEIATIVTTKSLDIVATGPVLAIHQPLHLLASMDEWNTRQHGSSGLTERVRLSTIDEKDAEKQTLHFLQSYVTPKTSPMCGNSICQDRRFLYRYMPELENYFHYRNLDVSSIKELAKYWRIDLLGMIKKESKHLALQDIMDSIEELKIYKNHFFKLNP